MISHNMLLLLPLRRIPGNHSILYTHRHITVQSSRSTALRSIDVYFRRHPELITYPPSKNKQRLLIVTRFHVRSCNECFDIKTLYSREDLLRGKEVGKVVLLAAGLHALPLHLKSYVFKMDYFFPNDHLNIFQRSPKSKNGSGALPPPPLVPW